MPNDKPSTTLIPERFIDVPSQRLYYLSLGLFLQATKAFDVLHNLFTTNLTSHYCRKWLCIDFAYIAILSQLRIPRLTYSKAAILVQILFLWFLDGLIFGSIRIDLWGKTSESPGYSNLQRRPELASTLEPFHWTDAFSPLRLAPYFSDVRHSDQHLLGQHTVRMSPVTTAQFNPDGLSFCLSPPSYTTFIPIIVNRSSATSIRYTFTPLAYVEGQSGTGRLEHIELNARELKAVDQARSEGLQVARTNSFEDDLDEYDEDDDEASSSEPRLKSTESLSHIRVTKPGTIRLERVLDTFGVVAKLVYPLEVLVVPCPTAQYIEDSPLTAEGEVRCSGENQVDLTIDIRGVPPLSLKWSKDTNGNKETFIVDSIENVDSSQRPPGDLSDITRSTPKVPQKFRVPLSLPVDSLGRVTFILESVIDGLGNVVLLDQGKSNESLRYHGVIPDSKTARSLNILRRPTTSFHNCGPGNPAPILIGSEASLVIAVNVGDFLDAPWSVHATYFPTGDSQNAPSTIQSRDFTLQTEGDSKELQLDVSAPGEYIITGIKGKHCEGDVLSPELCKVVEKPLPTAEIEWKRIHECSGDTGVSASLILHGTPPFQIYYRTQRNNESPRDLMKTFATSRGSITLQPEHSGHYFHTFLQLSDANYKKIPLDGPSMDQVVHPLAAADFVAASGRNRKAVSSCSGNVVDVDVDLRGMPPWNLELQIVGPRSTSPLVIRDIKSSPARIQVPLPSAVDKEGGTFEIDLVRVEDMYGCKRQVSVPGISVSVRRVQPTAKFYGKDGHRKATILEGEEAELPLRLTGDGPWRVKYHLVNAPDTVQTATLTLPNDLLRVRRQGVYELLEVNDSQCPGSIIVGESNYDVSWVPRPSAKLAPQTLSTFESYNRSHILMPICQDHDDFVDLDLTGRPPFQIMYNVATNDESGGRTIVLDQPTISSIQHRTRFQLHTSSPGRKYYEVKQIGDTAYPLHKHRNAVIPRSERLLFEQEVLTKPSAKFKTDNRLSYCLNDVLVPREPISPDGTILLDGTPPFHIQLSIKNLAAGKVRMETIEVHENSWKLNLPSYYFTSVGPYLVTIESVRDASHCEPVEFDPLRRSVWVDVAETAAIIPLEKRKDFCVGDTIQFELEGTPPWTIGYRINGRSYTREVKASPFSITQQQSGEFTITSIAHQQKMCKAVITNFQLTIHSLPSAQVGHGKRIYQNIYEGDQAEIVFTLIGEPPFTFTYQRAEPSPKKGGKPGKILETHTVSSITMHEYSVFSALEGTWTVTSISDRYCRYPMLQDGSSE